MDENITDTFRDILIAHEPEHFALHKDIAMMKGFQEQEVPEKRDSEPLETEANLFAAELLLPDEDVLTCLGFGDTYTVRQIRGSVFLPSDRFPLS